MGPGGGFYAAWPVAVFHRLSEDGGPVEAFVADCWARRRSPAGPGARRSQYTAPFQWTPTMCSVAAFCGGGPVMAGTISATIFDVDGVLVNSPHERAWREALAGFADPAQFTTTFYQAYVAGKPRLEGARSALERLGVANAAAAAEKYA